MNKLLIHADDDPRVRESTKFYVETLFPGVNVEEVEDGTELVKRVSVTQYDAILTDNTMIRMDGLTAIKQIRGLKISTPIGMMSGDGVEVAALKAGANYFIPKTNMQRLNAFLQRYLER